MSANSNFRFHKNNKPLQQYKRSLHLEALEERALLSVSPWNTDPDDVVPAVVSPSENSENLATSGAVIMDLTNLEPQVQAVPETANAVLEPMTLSDQGSFDGMMSLGSESLITTLSMPDAVLRRTDACADIRGNAG